MRRLVSTTVIAVCSGCGAPSSGPTALPRPEVVAEIGPPWVIVHDTADAIVLRVGDSPDGARIQLLSDEGGRVPGATPIVAGRTLEVTDGDATWPLVSVGWPELPLQRVELSVRGVDLVARFYGPPLHAVTDHPEAPDDPVHTWVRLRPRGPDWRVVLDGLGTVSFPSAVVRPGAERGWTLDTAHGTVELHTDAPRIRAVSGTRWSLATHDSLDALEPYPRTALTLTP